MTVQDGQDYLRIPELESEPSLERRAYDAVLAWLVQGNGKPGQAIPLREFATALGMSRTPLRTALGRLEEQGLVSYSPRLGFAVNVPTPSDLRELFDIRLMCETHTLRTYFDEADFTLPTVLGDLVGETRRFAQVDPPTPESAQAFWAADHRFHRALVSLGRNQRLIDWWDLLHVNIHIQRAGRRAPLTRERFQRSATEHLEIVDAATSGDIKRACEALEAHVIRIREQTIQFMMGPDNGGFVGQFEIAESRFPQLYRGGEPRRAGE